MANKFYSDLLLQRNALDKAAIEVITDSANADGSAVESQIVFFDNTTPAASAGGDDWGYGKAPYIKYPAGWKAMITSAMVDTNAAATADLIPIRDGNGDIYVPTTPTGANSAASKAYVDSEIATVASGLKIRGDIQATFTGTADLSLPTALASSYPGTGTNYTGGQQTGDASDITVQAGDAWYLNSPTGTNTVTIGSSIDNVTQGDLVVAIVDSPSTIDDWIILENANEYATNTIAGVIRLASQGEVDSGTNDTHAVTPLTLQTKLDNQGYGKVFKQAITTLTGETTAISVGSGYNVDDVIGLTLFDTSGTLEPVVPEILSVAINGSDLEVEWGASPSISTSGYWAVTMLDN